MGTAKEFTCLCPPAFSGVQCNKSRYFNTNHILSISKFDYMGCFVLFLEALFIFNEMSPLSPLVKVSWDPSFITGIQTNYTAINFTLEYHIADIRDHPPITAIVPIGQRSVEVNNLKSGFDYSFTLIAAYNSTAQSFSVVYQKQSREYPL